MNLWRLWANKMINNLTRAPICVKSLRTSQAPELGETPAVNGAISLSWWFSFSITNLSDTLGGKYLCAFGPQAASSWVTIYHTFPSYFTLVWSSLYGWFREVTPKILLIENWGARRPDLESDQKPHSPDTLSQPWEHWLIISQKSRFQTRVNDPGGIGI